MSSLLPLENQKQLRREKIIRMISLLIFLLFASLVVGVILMLPSYFALVFSREDVLRRLDAQQKAFARQDIVKLEQSISAINDQSGAFEKNEAKRHRVAKLFANLASADDVDVKLSGVDLRTNPNGSVVLSVRGKVATRDALLLYIERLKHFSEFSAVHSPISNLLLGTDAPFEIEIDINKDAFHVSN